MRSQPPLTPRRPAPGPLADCLIALAGTPDDSSWITSQLVAIAQLAADLVEPSCHASVTAYRDDGYVTVAASSDDASAIDEAQYADQAGPCLDALDAGFPVAAPDVAVGATWPLFRATATRVGVRATLSVPLFAGRGTAVAALNLYGRDRAGMAALTAGVQAVYATQGSSGGAGRSGARSDAGIVAGLIGAFAVRAVIQEAIGAVSADTGRTADGAYLFLRLRAAETGVSLTDTATAVITERQWESMGL